MVAINELLTRGLGASIIMPSMMSVPPGKGFGPRPRGQAWLQFQLFWPSSLADRRSPVPARWHRALHRLRLRLLACVARSNRDWKGSKDFRRSCEANLLNAKLQSLPETLARRAGDQRQPGQSVQPGSTVPPDSRRSFLSGSRGASAQLAVRLSLAARRVAMRGPCRSQSESESPFPDVVWQAPAPGRTSVERTRSCC